MSSFYEQSKNEFINYYQEYYMKRINDMIKIKEESIKKYGDEITQLETILIEHGYKINSYNKMNIVYDYIDKNDKYNENCYYKVNKTDYPLIISIGLKISSKFNRPYLMISGSLDKKINKTFNKNLLNKIYTTFNHNSSVRVHLLADSDEETKEVFFKLLDGYSTIQTEDDVNKLNLICEQLKYNKKINDLLKKL